MPLFVDVLFIQWLGGDDATAMALNALLKVQVWVICHIEVHSLTIIL
jgi:hypothetical protein